MKLSKTQGINGIGDVIHHYGILMPLGIGLFCLTIVGVVMLSISSIIDYWNSRPELIREKILDTILYVGLIIIVICVTYGSGVFVLDTWLK